MKRLMSFVALAISVFFATIAVAGELTAPRSEPKGKLPQSIASELKSFEAVGSHRARVAYARPFAWGTGNYKGVKFTWFAFTNTDAYFQLRLGTAVGVKELESIAALKDSIKRSYEAQLTDGACTWIGTSNDWMFEENELRFAVRKGGDPMYIGQKIVDYYVGRLNSAAPSLKLRVGGMLE